MYFSKKVPAHLLRLSKSTKKWEIIEIQLIERKLLSGEDLTLMCEWK